jgi:hypothetical protein
MKESANVPSKQVSTAEEAFVGGDQESSARCGELRDFVMDEERNISAWWIAAAGSTPQGLARRVQRQHPRVPETERPEWRCSAEGGEIEGGGGRRRHLRAGWRRGRGSGMSWLFAVTLLAVAGLCGGQTRINDCRSGVSASVIEAECPAGSAESYRYFKVTISGKALEVYTSIITPSGAQCAGTGSDFLCTAPTTAITAYDVQVELISKHL